MISYMMSINTKKEGINKLEGIMCMFWISYDIVYNGFSDKYIIFHDTTTFGQVGEGGQYPGLNPAINEFLLDNDDWFIKEIFTNNNGLTVLERL